MNDGATLTLYLSTEMTHQLTELAERTRESPSRLAERAIGGYLERERDVAAAIERGIADGRAGRVVDHEAAMDEIDAAIERVAARQA